MLPDAPSYAVKILGREDGPDEQMRSENLAGYHDEENAERREKREVSDMLQKHIASFASLAMLQKEQIRRGCPVDRPRPVADESENADSEDVEAGDTVVGAREVNRRYCVCATEGEERCVL